MKHKIVFAPSFDLLSDEHKIEGKKIVKLLEDAMDEYYQGKPFPYLDLYKPDDFTYFDSGMEKRKNSV